MLFEEFLVLGLILATAVGTGAALGAAAFFRLKRYRGALMEQAARIAALEAMLAGSVLTVTPSAAVATLAPAAPVPASPPSAEVIVASFPKPAPAPALPERVAAFVSPPRAIPARVAPSPIARDIAPPQPAGLLRHEAFRRPFEPALASTAVLATARADQAVQDRAPVAVQLEAPRDSAIVESVPATVEALDEAPPAETSAAPLMEAADALETVLLRPEAPHLGPAAPASAPSPADDVDPLARPRLRPEIFWWAGGAVIAAAVIAALIVAFQNGTFNQLSQLLLGYFLAAGMIAGAEALRRRNVLEPPTDWQARHTPKILAAVGVVCGYGISYVGLARLGLLPPGAALGLMGGSALGAFVLSLWHGRMVAWTGLAAGFAAPALVSVVTAAAPAFFAYLFAIAAAAFALARHRDWHALAAGAAVLALGWGAAWSMLFLLPSGMGAAGAFGVALAALGVSFAWDRLAEPLTPAAIARLDLPWSAQAWIGVVAVLGAIALLLAFAVRGEGAGGPAVAALVIVTAVLAAAAAFREGLSPAPLAAAAAALTALALWPPILISADARAFAGCAGALGFASSVGGWLMMARNLAPAPGAMLAALVPAATLLIAYLRLGGVIDTPFGWGGLALVLAAFNGFALDAISKAAGGASRAPGAAAAFAAAAAVCAVMAGAFAFDNVRMAAGIALLLAPLAWLDKRLDIPALRLAGAAFAAATLALLSPIALMRADIDPRPFVNLIAPTFLIAIVSLWAGARLFALGPAGYDGRVTVFVRIALVALVLAFGFAEIRHLANGGDMAARYVSLFEMGGHTTFLLAVACGIAWRFGAQDRPLLHWTEIFVFVLATAHMAIAGLGILAPWWGAEPAPAPGRPVFNALLAAYALPAALFALYAWLRARLGPSLRAHVAGGAALVSALVWLLLEVRRAFHPDAMAVGPIGPAEQGAFSLALVAASAAIVPLALRLGRGPGAMVLRIVAAMLTAMGVLKALALDIGTVDGPVRYAAYALVAAIGVGALIGYHRYVFPRASVGEDRSAHDANLLPPRP